jgi:uncharacterized membrane protein
MKYLTAAIIAMGAMTTVAANAERGRTYTAIDIPGAASTLAQGINSRGDVVGLYVDGSGTHGFVARNGSFTTIDYPGAAYTDARGINARGEIVGSYRMSGEPPVNLHGYLRSKHGEFTPIDFPDHTNTIAQRITSTGVILGCRHDADMMATMRGVMINGRDTSEVAEIGAFASMNNGSTPDGSLLVGLFTDMDTGRGRAYLLYGGDTFIPFDVPGSVSTSGWDVNGNGQVVGVYRDAADKIHGFLWEDFQFSSIDYPAATATRAFGINSRGAIVGAFVDADGTTHGFIARGRRDHDRK